MGLGKTAQTVAFIAALYTLARRPAVVFAPLSTLTHWEREFRAWTPQLNVILFTGVPEARDIMRAYELYGDRGGRVPIVDVVLTSFEMGLTEASVLKRISWALMVRIDPFLRCHPFSPFD